MVDLADCRIVHMNMIAPCLKMTACSRTENAPLPLVIWTLRERVLQQMSDPLLRAQRLS